MKERFKMDPVTQQYCIRPSEPTNMETDSQVSWKVDTIQHLKNLIGTYEDDLCIASAANDANDVKVVKRYDRVVSNR